MEPLTEPQIHAAIRALDAGDRPARATLRTALLMALAWHAAQAEIVALRGRMAQLEEALQPLAAVDVPDYVSADLDLMGGWLQGDPLDSPYTQWIDITVGDVRRAKALL